MLETVLGSAGHGIDIGGQSRSTSTSQDTLIVPQAHHSDDRVTPRNWRNVKLKLVPLAVAVAALTLTATATPATTRHHAVIAAQKSWPVPHGWHAPRSWLPAAICLHEHEGAWNDAAGNGYEGGLQFLRSTWTSVGGSVDKHGHWASVATPREQLYRMWLVWKRDRQSFREWGTAGRCGLH
jgi:hypothetical protein